MNTHNVPQRHLACPVCGRTYAIENNKEYCQHDAERLEVRLGAAVGQTGPAQAPAPTPSPTHRDATLASESAMPRQAQAQDAAAHASAKSAVNPGAAQAEPSGAEPPPAADPSRLKSFLSRLNVRMRNAADADGGQADSAKGATTATHAETPNPDNPLPPQVVEKGWQVAGVLTSSEAVDTWQVVRPSGTSPAFARFCRFRARVLTTPTLYKRLESHNCTALPTLLEHGTVNLRGGASASFELTLLPNRQTVQPLLDWLALAPPSETKALDLLPRLVGMLTDLAAIGVQPVSFSPAQMLRDKANGQIMLDNLAALAETSHLLTDYRPELDQNALISRLWSAPELAEQLVVSPKGAIFCVGQLLALALWGQALDVAALRAGNVAFASISDARLARILQGCLWVESIHGRWNLEQLQTALTAALNQLPPVADWAQLGPRAMGKAFALDGQAYWRVEDLLAHAVLPQKWVQATARLSAMLDWIESGSPWASVAQHLRKQLEDGRSPDHVLIKLAHAVIQDLPCTWRGLDLSDEHARYSLVNLAQRNLATDTTAQESELLEALFLADLPGAFVTAARPTW